MKNEYFLLLLFVCVCLFANSCCACFVCLLIRCDCLHLLLSPSLALFGNSLSLSLSLCRLLPSLVFMLLFIFEAFFICVYTDTHHTHTHRYIPPQFLFRRFWFLCCLFFGISLRFDWGSFAGVPVSLSEFSGRLFNAGRESQQKHKQEKKGQEDTYIWSEREIDV